MGRLERLDVRDLRAVFVSYRDALAANEGAINQLNVYPVPDGDTGTNMTLTLASVVTELENVDDDVVSVCKAIGHGSLMGARGNSGVILSQILRGLADVLVDRPSVDTVALADGFVAAADAAYAAVLEPVEGTILTVARSLADELTAASSDGAGLADALERARAAGAETLDQTPTMLPVLATAGVVDAGGAGLLLLVDAMLHVVEGRPMPEPRQVDAAVGVGAAVAAAPVEPHAGAHGPGGDQRYEVMFFLEAADAAVPQFRDAWSAIGDSIVVVGGDGLWNCHIHTNDIGASIEAGIEAGRPRDIRITDLFEQVDHVEQLVAPPTRPDPVRTAVVAVAVGPGVQLVFESLGVRGIVSGGQTMNPSTQELVDAVERLAAEEVVILPNNSNIIPVAAQVNGLVDVRVRVLPTRSIPEGIASLYAYDPEASADENVTTMRDAGGRVIAGEVTRAVRDSSSGAGDIAEGDFIGLDPSGIRVVAATALDAACELLGHIVTPDHELVTIIAGAQADEAETALVVEWLTAQHPGVEGEVINGGQPLYAYYFGVE